MTLSFTLSLCFFACSIVCWLHVKKIMEDRCVRGVSLLPTFVFMTTNIIEMVYFWERSDMWSVVGAGSMLLSNLVWTVAVFYFFFDGRKRLL
jgi:hypothetical protein